MFALQNIILTILIIIGIVFGLIVLLSKYNKADKSSIEEYVKEQNVKRVQFKDDILLFSGSENKSALIFYPGSNIEYNAYEPLMAACAKRGIMSILVKMPLNKAIFNLNVAKKIKQYFPEIKTWYIGGHSLGGMSAAIHAAKYPDEYTGIIILASYSPKDLTKTNLKVLSIYGSKDMIMNRKSYNKYKKNLPKNFTEYIIEDGIHRYFGMYGFPKNQPYIKISNVEQIELTADKIEEFVN